MVKSQAKEIGGSAETRAGVLVDLPFKPPYDWASILRFFQSHSIPGVERVTNESFARVFRLGDVVGYFTVGAISRGLRLQLRIVPNDPAIIAEATRRVRKMFDLDCDPAFIAASFAGTPRLAALCRQFPGLRVARGWDPFETAICAILGQLVSARQRSNLIGQLVESYGEKIVHPISGEEARLFPDARILARSKLDAVRTTVARREAIRELSRRVLSGTISFSAEQHPLAFRKALREVNGLGLWTAEYISLRALGDADAFPKTDLILKRALAHQRDLDLARLAPWRAYAATYLWKEYAETQASKKEITTKARSTSRFESPE
jgi:AraC family transcriptional regulator, regulatory protein of adaptative response / DNA-3-methyladenine glycosylase II